MRLNGLTREIFKERFPPKKVLFRVDAGRVEGVSFGHLFRCLILAKELERSVGSEIVLLMRDYKTGVDFAKSSGYILKTIGALLSKPKHDSLVKEWILNIKPDCLVVDLPDNDPNFYLEYARRHQILTVCLDDTAKHSYQADVLLNSSILVDRSQYGYCLPTTRFLLGMDYFIMDDYIIKTPRVVNKDYISVLITFGGSDVSGLTMKTVHALAELHWYNINFTVILGPGFKGKHAIIDISRPLRNIINIVQSPKDMKTFFAENDLAICAGGRTLYELNKIGIPCLAIASSKNEALVIKKFMEKGLLLSGLEAWDKQLFLKELRYAFSSLSKKLAIMK